MPRLIPEVNLETHEYVTVRKLGTLGKGPGQDNYIRVLRKKVITP